MDFVEVAKTNEIPADSMKNIAIHNQSILISNINGKYYAIGEKCTHAKGSLSKGKLEDKIVTCPRHDSKFDVTTGNVVGGPAKQNEPTYEVKVEGNSIKVRV
jgi:3-phenylpropionate/trans-cinnamate dioxygenase ferredoxin component